MDVYKELVVMNEVLKDILDWWYDTYLQ